MLSCLYTTVHMEKEHIMVGVGMPWKRQKCTRFFAIVGFWFCFALLVSSRTMIFSNNKPNKEKFDTAASDIFLLFFKNHEKCVQAHFSH